MAEIRVSQYELAAQLGISQSTLNGYLNGHQTPPADFARRVTAALDKLEKAERAADKARQWVLKRPVKELGGVL